MNIIQPGDHVVIAIPASFSTAAVKDHHKAMVDELPRLLESGSKVPFTVTFTPLGGLDEGAYVLFVIRDTPELPEVRTYVSGELMG